MASHTGSTTAIIDRSWKWYKSWCRRKGKKGCRRVKATAKSRRKTKEKAHKLDSAIAKAYGQDLMRTMLTTGNEYEKVEHLLKRTPIQGPTKATRGQSKAAGKAARRAHSLNVYGHKTTKKLSLLQRQHKIATRKKKAATKKKKSKKSKKKRLGSY